MLLSRKLLYWAAIISMVGLSAFQYLTPYLGVKIIYAD